MHSNAWGSVFLGVVNIFFQKEKKIHFNHSFFCVDRDWTEAPNLANLAIDQGSCLTLNPERQWFNYIVNRLQVILEEKERNREGEGWNWAGPYGAPGHESLSVSPISRPFLSSKAQVQTIVNQEWEGMQRQGRGSQETIVQPWGRVLVQPQGINITISLSSSTELKPPTSGRY